MNLNNVITELKLASAELKADNDAFEAKALKRFKKNTADKCECSAYPFPHRVFGGSCTGDDEVNFTTTSYHNTRQAMLDAGHKGSDFYEVV